MTDPTDISPTEETFDLYGEAFELIQERDSARNVAVYLEGENASLLAAITAVRALHTNLADRRPGKPAVCEECFANWPCPTLRAIDGEQA